MNHHINRRQFLTSTATGAGAVLLGANLPTAVAQAAGNEQWPPKLPTVNIYRVYVGRTGGIYLSRPTAEVEKFEKHLADIEQKLGDVKFLGGELVPPEDVKNIIPKLQNADGLLLFHLSGHGGDAPGQALNQLVDVGLPTALFSQPFSGHGWMYFPQWRKQGKKVVLLPSADWNEIEKVVKLMRVGPHLRHTRIIVVNRPLGTAAACSAEKVKKQLGADVITVTIEQTIREHQSVDPKAAEAEAQEYWLSKANKILEPTKEEVINSARFYLAIKNLMTKAGAHAVTSSGCMGEPAKGCLTFSKLNDLGMVGACEGDMDSTLTMLVFSYAFGIPGVISDPVFDVSKNALIHFHCTSATKMDGPGGKRLPFNIRTQTDSGRGVALEVENRVGQAVTCAKFINLDTMLISTGEIFDVTRDPLGCRTQFWTKVRDANSMFLNWGGGVLEGDIMTMLHRVVFYGDHIRDIQNLGVLMGFKVVEEA